MEEGGDGQGGDDDVGLRAGRGEALDERHRAEVGECQAGGENAVDQRAADDQVDVEQPVAQDGERDRDRKRRRRQQHDRARQDRDG